MPRRRIAQWRPRIVKINCAFHNVADAGQLASSLTEAGYDLLAAHWRDDNSFNLRSVAEIVPLASLGAPAWDYTNLIGFRDARLRDFVLTIGRLYAGEEQRIAELRVANAVRSDTIARLEDALIARQPSNLFKLRPS